MTAYSHTQLIYIKFTTRSSFGISSNSDHTLILFPRKYLFGILFGTLRFKGSWI